MINRQTVIATMRECFKELVDANLIPTPIELKDDTIIFGGDSPLDSLAFVSLVSAVEEKLSVDTGNDLAVDLTEIDDFNPDQPNLTVTKLADFLVQLCDGRAATAA